MLFPMVEFLIEHIWENQARAYLNRKTPVSENQGPKSDQWVPRYDLFVTQAHAPKAWLGLGGILAKHALKYNYGFVMTTT